MKTLLLLVALSASSLAQGADNDWDNSLGPWTISPATLYVGSYLDGTHVPFEFGISVTGLNEPGINWLVFGYLELVDADNNPTPWYNWVSRKPVFSLDPVAGVPQFQTDKNPITEEDEDALWLQSTYQANAVGVRVVYSVWYRITGYGWFRQTVIGPNLLGMLTS